MQIDCSTTPTISAPHEGITVNHNELAPAAGMPRRDFLRNSILLALPLATGSAMALTVKTGGSLAASELVYVPPTRARGSAVIDVRNYGARGDGVHDDTAAIQTAINALPSTGGTIEVPAGIYMIDAVRSLNLRNYMHMKLAPDAQLVAKPNSADKYSVLRLEIIHDVEISGGQIIGERDQHTGTTGEAGHGIVVKGSSRITIRDMRLSKGWGDGISVGPRPQYKKNFIYSRDVAVANVVCTGNRRNGLSITNVIGMKVYDSEFSDTHGTKPECGIDVEPNGDIDGLGYNDQVRIENCVMRGNAKYAINVWNRARNLTVTKCTMENNKYGLVSTGLNSGTFTHNLICNHRRTGMHIKVGTRNVDISGNVSYKNYLDQGTTMRLQPFYLTGTSTKVQKDLIVGTGTSDIRVGSNYYK